MDTRQPRAVVHLRPRRHAERLPRGDRHGRRSRLTQITRVRTGISGITGSSPALSVATKSGTAAFSLYADGRYGIYVTEPERCAGRPRPFGRRRPSAAVLPPLDRKPSDVQALLDEPDPRAAAGHGDPPSERAVQVDADARRVGAAQRRASASSRFGAGGRRAASAFQFGDMLGDHSLTTVVQLNSGLTNNFSLKNTAAQVLYFNQARRWNWGIVGGQVPYLSGGFQSVSPPSAANRSQIDQAIIFRQTEQSAARHRRVPVQPRAARRVPGRGDADVVRSDRRDDGVLAEDRRNCIGQDSDETSLGAAADAGDDVGGAGVRHVELRRRPARCRASAIGSKRRRPSVRCGSRACWPTTADTSCRCRSTRSRRASCTTAGTAPAASDDAAVPAVPRLSEPRARLRRRLVPGRRLPRRPPSASARRSIG